MLIQGTHTFHIEWLTILKRCLPLTWTSVSVLPLDRSLSTAHFAACWLFLSRSTATMMELSLALASCSALYEDDTANAEANILNGEHHSLSSSIQQSACNPSENRRTPTTDSKERRLQEAKQRGERDKGGFCLSSSLVALFCPAPP